MSRLVRVEMRKLFDTRASMGLLIAMGVLTILIAAVSVLANINHYRDAPTSSSDIGDPLSFGDLFTSMSIPIGIILPVMAILLVTSEWSQRTALATFTMEPRRERIVIAKLATSLIAAAGAVVFALIVAAIVNVLAGLFVDGAGSWNLSVGQIGQMFLIHALGMLVGFGFAALFLNTPAAIVAYFVLPIAVSLVSSLVPWINENLSEWINTDRAGAPLLSGAPMTGADWAHVLVAFGIWILLPLGFGIARIMRSEVK